LMKRIVSSSMGEEVSVLAYLGERGLVPGVYWR